MKATLEQKIREKERDTRRKMPIARVLKRGEEVHTGVVENCLRQRIMPILKVRCLGNRLFLQITKKAITD